MKILLQAVVLAAAVFDRGDAKVRHRIRGVSTQDLKGTFPVTRNDMPRALKKSNPNPTVHGKTCDHHVVVVGLGWAGISAMYEFKQFDELFGTDIDVLGIEAEDYYGGRGIAAELFSGGEDHPFMTLIHNYNLYSQNPNSDDYLLMTSQKWFDIYYHDAVTNAEVDSSVINEAKNAWKDAYECLQKCANDNYNDASARVLSTEHVFLGSSVCDPPCNWNPSSLSLLDRMKRIFRWYELQWEFLTKNSDMSPFGNVPLWTYYLWQDKDFFITTRSDGTEPNSANVARRLVENYPETGPALANNMQLNTRVTEIDWGTSGCVEVYANSRTITAEKVIYTGSAGVLAEAVTLFSPSLPTNKRTAIEDTFYIEPPITTAGTDPSMGLYRRLTVQFSGAAYNAANVPFTEFMFVARSDGKEYKCSLWQDLGHGTKGFFEGSHAFECSLVNEYFEEANSLVVTDGTVKELIKDTLNQVLGLDETTYIDSCERVNHLFLRDPENFPAGKNCLFQIRDGAGNENWKGAWSTFKTGWTNEDYTCVRNPLPFQSGGTCDPVTEPVLYFAGEAVCPVYVGFLHGAWESGRVEARKIIDLLTDGTAPDDWSYTFPPPNCEIPDGTPPIRQSKSVP